MRNRILTGQSIDGRVYADRFGWTSERRRAFRMTEAEATKRMAERQLLNAECDPDAAIGRLTIRIED